MRLKPKERKEQLLKIAIDQAVKLGYDKVRRRHIAEVAGVSIGLIDKRLGTLKKMQRLIMRKAVRDGVLEIIAQGLVNNDPHAKKADDNLKQQAMAKYLS